MKLCKCCVLSIPLFKALVLGSSWSFQNIACQKKTYIFFRQAISPFNTRLVKGQTCFFYSSSEVKFSQFEEKVSRKIYIKKLRKKQCLVWYN